MKHTNKKLYLSHSDVKALVATIGQTMLTGDWRPDYIVGIGRGGLVPAVLLSHLTDIKMYSLDISLRDNSEQCSNAWMAEDAYGYIDKDQRTEDEISSNFKGKNILIVDDINDTGATFEWLIDDWQSGCIPADEHWENVWGGNVKFAVLVNNESSEFNGVDFSGMDINKAEKDIWVEFPYENWWKVQE